MVGHDDECVQSETALVAIAEERGDHQLRVCGALEDAVALVSEDRDRIRALLLANGGHDKRAYPRG